MDSSKLSIDSGKTGRKRWMTAEEIADLYGVSVYSVRRAVRAGRLRVREVLPGLIRIDPSSVPAGKSSRETGW